MPSIFCAVKLQVCCILSRCFILYYQGMEINDRINNYIQRLQRCGYNASEATRTAYDMRKNFGYTGLDDYVKSVEDDVYVDKLQPEPSFYT